MQDYSRSLASLDGEITPAPEARVPATDDGLLRGDGVFEAVRLYGGRPFRLEEHLQRLERSAANLRLEFDLPTVRAELDALLERVAGQPEHEAVRIVLTRGGRRLLLTEQLPDLPKIARLGTITYAPTRVLDGVKSLSYAGNMLARRLAVERGFDDALLVTPHGRVLEGPTSSVFWVREQAIFTPPLDEHILASITRALVIDVTGAEERPTSLDDLLGADEIFLASTMREVHPVGAVDEREFGAPGPVTLGASEAVSRRLAEELGATAG